MYKGSQSFAGPDEIHGRLDELHGKLKSVKFLRGLSKAAMLDGLAYTLSDLNEIHPFREGNGRSQRMFVSQLAENCGYQLDFSHVSENWMRDVSIAAAHGNLKPMRYMLSCGVSEMGTLQKVSSMLRLARLPIPPLLSPEEIEMAKGPDDRFSGPEF